MHDPPLRQQYLDTVVEPARQAVSVTLERATANGDLRDDADRELLLELIASLVHHRSLYGPDHLIDDEAWSVIEMLMRGVAADYPALLAHSEALEVEHTDGRHHAHLDVAPFRTTHPRTGT